MRKLLALSLHLPLIVLILLISLHALDPRVPIIVGSLCRVLKDAISIEHLLEVLFVGALVDIGMILFGKLQESLFKFCFGRRGESL